MAKIICQVESLKSLRIEFNKRGISRFNSIGDIERFKTEYENEKRIILKSHEDLVNDEIKKKLYELFF